ncbi:MAG: YciI family protein [Hylemonella sp.]
MAVSKGKRHVVDGPFAESKELIGGFYIIDVGSLGKR